MRKFNNFIYDEDWVDYTATPQPGDRHAPEQLRAAFICGYIMALRYHRIPDYEILLAPCPGDARDAIWKKINSLDKTSRNIVFQVYMSNDRYNENAFASLEDQANTYLYDADNPSLVFARFTPDAFYSGFKTALIIEGHYDHCITMGGEALVNIIASYMYACEEREGNLRYGSQRISTKVRREYREMIKNGEESSIGSNTDNVIAEIHAERNIEDH